MYNEGFQVDQAFVTPFENGGKSSGLFRIEDLAFSCIFGVLQ